MRPATILRLRGIAALGAIVCSAYSKVVCARGAKRPAPAYGDTISPYSPEVACPELSDHVWTTCRQHGKSGSYLLTCVPVADTVDAGATSSSTARRRKRGTAPRPPATFNVKGSCPKGYKCEPHDSATGEAIVDRAGGKARSDHMPGRRRLSGKIDCVLKGPGSGGHNQPQYRRRRQEESADVDPDIDRAADEVNAAAPADDAIDQHQHEDELPTEALRSMETWLDAEDEHDQWGTLTNVVAGWLLVQPRHTEQVPLSVDQPQPLPASTSDELDLLPDILSPFQPDVSCPPGTTHIRTTCKQRGSTGVYRLTCAPPAIAAQSIDWRALYDHGFVRPVTEHKQAAILHVRGVCPRGYKCEPHVSAESIAPAADVDVDVDLEAAVDIAVDADGDLAAAPMATEAATQHAKNRRASEIDCVKKLGVRSRIHHGRGGAPAGGDRDRDGSSGDGVASAGVAHGRPIGPAAGVGRPASSSYVADDSIADWQAIADFVASWRTAPASSHATCRSPPPQDVSLGAIGGVPHIAIDYCP